MTFQQMLNYETKQFMWNSQMANPKENIEHLIESNKSQIFRRTLIHYCTQYGIQNTLDCRLTLYYLGKKYGVHKLDINGILYGQLGIQTTKQIMARTLKDYLRYLCWILGFMIVFAAGVYAGSIAHQYL